MVFDPFSHVYQKKAVFDHYLCFLELKAARHASESPGFLSFWIHVILKVYLVFDPIPHDLQLKASSHGLQPCDS